MKILYPPKLKKWDNIRVIAPARSLKLLWQESIDIALSALKDFGFNITFWKNVNECDEFFSSSIESRIQDLHEAFQDSTIQWIFTVIWWYNSNQLLDYIDYELIKNNPKILCGFSDITALSNAIFQKTGLVWYSWPHFSSWWMKHWFEYTKEYFEKCCMRDTDFSIIPSLEWSDDPWYLDQENRNFIKNEGYWVLNPWKAQGRLLWGHIPCIESLQWTSFLHHNESDSVYFIEIDADFSNELFDRALQSLIHQPGFQNVKGIVIWRFQHKVEMTKKILEKIIFSKKELQNIPIIANVDFWHTTPFFTFPIWWEVYFDTTQKEMITILNH